ncbi:MULTISPECIES: hypothetical protein [Streptomyces]|uniref:DUF202 domain-containing protein n=1 Tax=Streptomyces glycanivorans TaxID=3033808 RepID=A0ABY9JA36_9ACTN|nr:MULTISPECIES: hypothetical protein [unclassified Streptomyces]WSQ76349.1 hypothetical protein OG725_04260 [Streptomyces sp. NBC_01213]TXS20336.1 hypothetical protein EAO68_00195 [Streptomyces sp. wa22]WLQ62836.1 hypothetical protein P8A20_04170 [Streptomyces sp. Alt3]WSQ83598.1 hypothetical protein OG722_04225 [Streptomyces sp. NBC_01212]WSR10374.1 hypothetical protein OG265_32100 [Streptomyces sp. NBC_01208]
MALVKRVALAPRALRQLRRVRSVYLAGMLLSVLGLLSYDDSAAGGRQTVIAGIFLLVFAALLTLTAVQLWRHGRTVHCSTAKRLTRIV